MARLLSTLLATAFLGTATASAADTPKVAVSIPPLHSLAAALLDGITEPALILDTAGSVHHGSLRPSQASMIQDADLVLWFSPGMEGLLANALEGSDKAVALAKTDDDDHEGHDHDEHGDEKHSADDHAEHAHDPHVWLDPLAMVDAAVTMKLALEKAYPDLDKQRLAANLDRTQNRLVRLHSNMRLKLNENLKPVIVWHDAFGALVERYDLKILGAVTSHEDTPPTAAAMQKLRDFAKDGKVGCIISEPGAKLETIATLREGTDVSTVTVDILGSDLELGPELYFTMMNRMVESIATCKS